MKNDENISFAPSLASFILHASISISFSNSNPSILKTTSEVYTSDVSTQVSTITSVSRLTSVYIWYSSLQS
jgi:hypothetical protein